MPTLTEILKSKIGKGGKSKAYVASHLGVSEKTIENYMNGKREPKQAALVELSKMLDFSLSELSEQNVPRYSNDIPKIESKAISSPMAGNYLEMIIKDNHELIEANKRLVIAHETIARTNEKLAESLTASFHSERNEVFDAMLPGLRELLVDLGLGKLWKTKDEGYSNVRSKLFSGLLLDGEEDIRIDSGKPSRKKSS